VRFTRSGIFLPPRKRHLLFYINEEKWGALRSDAVPVLLLPQCAPHGCPNRDEKIKKSSGYANCGHTHHRCRPSLVSTCILCNCTLCTLPTLRGPGPNHQKPSSSHQATASARSSGSPSTNVSLCAPIVIEFTSTRFRDQRLRSGIHVLRTLCDPLSAGRRVLVSMPRTLNAVEDDRWWAEGPRTPRCSNLKVNLYELGLLKISSRNFLKPERGDVVLLATCS
jgi:hypothetical protein